MSNRIQTDDFYNHRNLSNICLTSAENSKYSIWGYLLVFGESIQSFCVRNKVLHYGSDEGVEMAVAYHSVISTVKLHCMSCWRYLGEFFIYIFNGCRDFLRLTPANIGLSSISCWNKHWNFNISHFRHWKSAYKWWYALNWALTEIEGYETIFLRNGVLLFITQHI